MRQNVQTASGGTPVMTRGLASRLLAAAAALAAGAAMALAVPAAAQASPAVARPALIPATRLAPARPGDVRDSCAKPAAGQAACLAQYLTDVAPHLGTFAADTIPDGYGPTDLQEAYDLPSAAKGDGQTIALIEEGDDPNAEADLGVYREQYRLPPCTTANGCFRKVDQAGGTTYPAPDPSWAEETSLDLDMVSAACPNCHILLVEARRASFPDLGAAVDEAVALGAKFISNSYGGAESAGLGQAYNAYYNHPGVAVVASAGDNGYGPEYPAASSYVTAVGGTALTRSDTTSRGWTETVWDDTYGATGSGCSVDEAKPSWQHDAGCPNRTVTDVSADADPATGVAVYDSYQFQGWDQFGGTSVGSPLMTAAYALAGTPLPGTDPASYPYAHVRALNDVTSGANGACTPDYVCTAERGYDGPTGLGTPHGVAAFTLAHGTLTGTVTSASTGAPLADARITVGAATVTTSAHGTYSLVVPAGSHTVTAADYTYASATRSGVTITSGGTRTANFTLTPQPAVTISGQVTDGSGHGWPLYATVAINGVPGSVYTDPYTGRYTMRVLPSASYTLQATAVTSGYQTASRQVSVGSGDVTQDIAVPVNSATACTAPGYTSTYANTYSQTFDGTSAPQGWTIVGNSRSWAFNDPGQRGNLTGGSGGFAVADPAAEGGIMFSSLITPKLDLSGDPNPVFTFDTYDTNNLTSDIWYSTDGGSTWNLLTQTISGGDLGNGSQPTSLAGPGPVAFHLPQAADVEIKFQLLGTKGIWEIDNFLAGNLTCTPQAGGLVAGVVTDANTGTGLIGATVTNGAQSGEQATTISTSGAYGLRGFYELFAAGNGSQPVTFSDGNYQNSSSTVQVTSNAVTHASHRLQAGDLKATPAPLTRTVTSGKAATVPVTITNSGGVAASFTLAARQPDGSDATWLSVTPSSGQVPAGGTVTVNVKLTSAGASGTSQPGSYRAAIAASTNTPYELVVPVTMKVTPLTTWGQITGTVTGATCDGGTTPLQNATVQVISASSSNSLLTGTSGRYAWWLDQSNNPVTLIASLNGWQPQVRTAKIKAGRTTTVRFTLQPDTRCAQ